MGLFTFGKVAEIAASLFAPRNDGEIATLRFTPLAMTGSLSPCNDETISIPPFFTNKKLGF